MNSHSEPKFGSHGYRTKWIPSAAIIGCSLFLIYKGVPLALLLPCLVALAALFVWVQVRRG